MNDALEIVGASRADGTSGSLVIEDGSIVSQPRAVARRLDASGLLLLPGIVDIHGDAFERQIMPRPSVSFAADIALLDTDRQLIANGITTAFHGVTISWEPGLRSLDGATQLVEAWQALRDRLHCDTRLHLRWETFALDAAQQVSRWLELAPAPILAFNDHTTMTVEVGYTPSKLQRLAERTGASADEYAALVESAWARREAVPEAVAAMAAQARECGAILLAHDERSVEERAMYRELGAVASEFPMNEATARAARAAGEHTVLGAPNVVRGGSHNNAVNATDSIAAGLCTVLASDYYYPAPLLAAFALQQRGTLPLHEAWKLISQHPAEVAGLHDRGALDVGMRADVLLVEVEPGRPASVVATLLQGNVCINAANWAGATTAERRLVLPVDAMTRAPIRVPSMVVAARNCNRAQAS